MQKYKNLTRKNNRNKFGASFLAAILVLTTLSTLSIFSAPAGAVCPNLVADANGPYFNYTDTPVTLDGSGSAGDIISWEWDIDFDGQYDDASGETVQYTWTNPGEYQIGLKVTDSCEVTDTTTADVLIVEKNPELEDSCGIDIALVLDSSGSIGGNLGTMKSAFIGFVDALMPSTPTQMSVTDFDDDATVLQTFTTNITLIKNAINSPTSGGCTNWEDALLDAYGTFDPRVDKPDLIIFASDGNPNMWVGGGCCSSTCEDTAVEKAIAAANTIKANGIRIITLGIDAASGFEPVDPDNLKAISSDDAYYSSGFDTLADTLAGIAGELCGGTVIVRKYVDDNPAENWEFTIEVDGGTASPTSDFTDLDGYITFEIELDDNVETAYVNVTEIMQAGYSFVTASALDCSGAPVGTLDGLTIRNIPVTKTCLVSCEFENTEVTDDCPPTTTKTFCGKTYPAYDYPNPAYGPDEGEHYWLTTDTLITLTAVDCPLENPSGIDYIYYEIWWDSDKNGVIDEAYDTMKASEYVYSDTTTFKFTEECLHLIKWYAVDLAGNQECMHYQYHRVDDTGPNQTITFGEPKLPNYYLHENGNYYTVVGPTTPIYITSDDTYEGTKDCAVGSSWLTYVVNWGEEWNVWDYSRGPYTVYDGDPEDIDDRPGIITVVEYMPESCYHEIHVWCEDLLENEGIERWKDFIVDAEAPEDITEYIGTQKMIGNEQYIHCSTVKRINSSDSGCIEGGSGVDYIYWKVQKITGPDTAVTIADGKAYDNESYYFNNGLVIVTGDHDDTVGKISIEIMVNEHCEHYIWHQSVDKVENYGIYDKQKVRIDCKPPITEKIIGEPQYDMGYWVTTDTIFELVAEDQEEPCKVGVEKICYRYGYDQDASGAVEENEFYDWVCVDGNYTSFNFTEECFHVLEWYAVDYFGNTEETHYQEHKVDNTPPNTTKYIGDPKYDEGYWVTTWTPFELKAVDLPPGCLVDVEKICYRIGFDENEDEVFDDPEEFEDWICVDGNYTTFTMPEECYHKLEWYSVDNLGNTEDTHEQYHRVDDTPPETIKTICGDSYPANEWDIIDDELESHEIPNFYVTTQTMITLTATDLEDPCAVGIDYIYYEIWWDSNNDGDVDTQVGGGTVYDNTVTFNFTEECLHEIRWYAVDYLGNQECMHYQKHRVDDTPPYSHKYFEGITCDDPLHGEDYWLKTNVTEIKIGSTDMKYPCDVGTELLHVELWWDSNNNGIIESGEKLWSKDIYDESADDYDGDPGQVRYVFKIQEDCLHEIRWYAVDYLGNQGDIYYQQHRVDSQPPETIKTIEQPKYGVEDFWVTTKTNITLTSTDKEEPCAVGGVSLHYEVWWDSDNDGVAYGDKEVEVNILDEGSDYVTFRFKEECLHLIRWFATDCLGNTELIKEQWHRVDDTPPETLKTIGTPECQEGYYVNLSTLFELDATDYSDPCDVGVKEIHYRIGYDANNNGSFEEYEFDPWQIISGNHTEFYMPEECYHRLEWYAVDHLGNTEEKHTQDHRVDDTPPETIKTFEGTTYGEDNYWVTTKTNISLKATDKEQPCAVGGTKLYYEVWWDSDNDGTVDKQVDVEILEEDDNYVKFRFLEECLHEIRWYAEDCLGNTEELQIQEHRVDDTPPETIKSFEGPTHGEDNYWLQDHGTIIKLDATDYTYPCDVGVDYIHVELWNATDGFNIDNMIWSKDIFDDYYEFNITEDCLHEIRWYAVDYLDNKENEHTQQHRVDSIPPETIKTIEGPRCPATQEDIDKFGLSPEEAEVFWLKDNDTWVKLRSVDKKYPCDVGVDYLYVELYLSTDEGQSWTELWNKTITDECPDDSDSCPDIIEYKFQIMEDCLHKIVWYAEDYLTNKEEIHEQYHRVDSQPPESEKTFIGPTYQVDDYPNPWYGPDEGENYWVTSDTEITLTATDKLEPCDVGVVGFNVKIERDQYCSGNYVTLFDGSVSAPYIYSFTFKEIVDDYMGYTADCYEGMYRITWNAYDCLGNTEEEKIQYHQVDDTGPHVVILKPTDGWYSDGECIPSVVFAEDIANPHCGGMNCGAVGIEDGKQGSAYLIDIFPEFDIIELDSTNFLYDADSHEFIGNVCIPQESGISDGIVIFAAAVEDNLGNDWGSIREMIHAIVIQALAECSDESCCMQIIADLWADFLIDQNLVFIGIDNTPPEVEIIEAEVNVGTLYVKANATDVLSGIVSGTPCYVTLGGVTLGTLPYDDVIGGCEGTLSTAGAPDEEQTLTVSVADRAGCIGSDSVLVNVPNLPGPTTTGTDVMPASSVIGTELTVNATTFSTIAKIADADYYVVDYWGNTVITGNLDPVDGAFDETSEDITTNIDTTDWDEGYYTIFVRGQDEHGRWGAYDEEEFTLVEEGQYRPVVCNIIYPEDMDEFEVTCDQKYLTVEINAYRPAYNGLPKDYEVDVKLLVEEVIEGSTETYYPIWNGEYFTVDIPIFKYQSNDDPGEIILQAFAHDVYYNSGSSFPINIFVDSTIDYSTMFNSGWNGPVNLALRGNDGSVTSVLASIDPYYDFVFEVGTWDNFWWNQEDENLNGGTLDIIELDGWYYIHMTESARFYIDNNCPIITIDYPSNGETFIDECIDQDISGYVCDIETAVKEVVLTIYDNDTGLYWNGTAWDEEVTELPCDFDEINHLWNYPGTDSIDYNYISDHKIILTATATDMAGNSCSDMIWYMFIDNTNPYIEIMYPEDEEIYDDCCEPDEIFGIAYDYECGTIVTDVYIQIKDATQAFNFGENQWWDGDSWEDDPTDLPCPYDSSIDYWSYEGTIPDWTNEHSYTVYAFADDAAGNTGCDEVTFTYECEEPCEPALFLDKQVWHDCYWDDYTEAMAEETVTFNLTIEIPETACELIDGYLEDYLPVELSYIDDSTDIKFYYEGALIEHMSGDECDPEIIPSGDNNTLRWASEQGYGQNIPANSIIYIEFDALVLECGDHKNTGYVRGNYSTTEFVDDQETAWVYAYCQQCEPGIDVEKYVWCPMTQQWIDNQINFNMEDTVYFNITVENIGTCTLYDWYIDDWMENGLTYNEVLSFKVVQGDTVWNLDSRKDPQDISYNVEDEGYYTVLEWWDTGEEPFEFIPGTIIYIELSAVVTSEVYCDYLENWACAEGYYDVDAYVWDEDVIYLDINCETPS